MADTAVEITAGTGTNIDTRTEGTNGNHRQVIVVGDPATNAGVAPVDATNGLSVNVTNAALTVDLGANNDVTVTNATAANLKVDGSDVTQPVSGTVTANLSATDNTVLDNIDTNTDSGAVVGGGTEATAQRVTIANDSTGVVSVDDNGGALTVDGTVTANLSATDNTVLDNIDTNTTGLAGTVSGSELQVDVVAALPAGTNAIGKLLAPDIDVTAHTNYAKKYYTSTGAATDGIIWSPAAGKRWHVVSMYLQTSAAATITLEDDKAGGDSAVWKGEFAANQGMTINFSEKYPLASGEDAADLTVTTTAGNIYITVTGYEV